MPVPRSDPTLRLPPGARRAALLELLRAHGRPASAAEVAAASGLHPNTARAHLEALVREGQARRTTEVRATRGRPRELYQPTGAPTPDAGYAVLARLLAEQLADLAPDPAAEAVRIGRRWAEQEELSESPAEDQGTPSGRQGGPAGAPDVGPVLDLLSRSGFAPELTADGARILLRHCPFRDVAGAHPQIVCGAHLGLIQGALDRVAPQVTATRIVPFVEPHLCVAELSPHTPAPPRATAHGATAQ